MSRGELPAQNRRRNAYAIRITKHWRRSSAPVQGSHSQGSPRIRHPENNSIPIGRGPAQFNAFYPQCSGQDLGPLNRDLIARALRIES
jgi:hypothetical protein